MESNESTYREHLENIITQYGHCNKDYIYIADDFISTCNWVITQINKYRESRRIYLVSDANSSDYIPDSTCDKLIKKINELNPVTLESTIDTDKQREIILELKEIEKGPEWVNLGISKQFLINRCIILLEKCIDDICYIQKIVNEQVKRAKEELDNLDNADDFDDNEEI